MNWGYRIVFSLAAFMLFIIGSTIYMVSKNKDTLEEDDYYEQSLHYDETYNKKESLLHDHAKPQVRVDQDTLYIQFTTKNNSGKLNFKRPDEGNLDISIPFSTATEKFNLPISTFKKGNWNLEIDWKNGANSYLSDHSVYRQ